MKAVSSALSVLCVLGGLALGCDSSDDGNTGGSSGNPPTGVGTTPANCTTARQQLLLPVASVSTGEVKIFDDEDGVVTVYVDASAGGDPRTAEKAPRIYLDIETPAKVSVSDEQATTSVDWDLALERAVIFTNSGQAGSGEGGAVKISKAFDSVTAADARSASLATETFLEADCTARKDASGAVKTTFDGWYDYDMATHELAPATGTWIVRGATGTLFKLQIVTWKATPDNDEGELTGRYKLKIAKL